MVGFLIELIGRQLLARLLVGGLVALASGLVFYDLILHHDEKVKASVVSDINAKGEKTRADAIQARANAESASDPVARLRAGFCRDCKPDVLNPKASNRQ